MKKNCPGCKALRDRATQPHADLGDLLLQVALHEASPQCREKKSAVKSADHK
ncbi:hypothetical protein [Streptomyces sp. NPDC050485]|uniref:hypothetical protein n=1 Tax=Streptomyces sp. NPDC050485 TaxID=3365617 RepID=UPI0037948E36